MRLGVQGTYAISFVYELDYFDAGHKILINLVYVKSLKRESLIPLASQFDSSKSSKSILLENAGHKKYSLLIVKRLITRVQLGQSAHKI